MGESLQQYLDRNGVAKKIVQEYCQEVVNAATTADELRDAAILVTGADQDPYVYSLREKVFERIKGLAGSPDRSLAEASAVGTALRLLA